MDAKTFEFTASMPREARFASAVRRLALHAAQYAGCGEGAADSFAALVEQAFAGCLHQSSGDVPLIFRRATGPLEVVVDGRVLTLTV